MTLIVAGGNQTDTEIQIKGCWDGVLIVQLKLTLDLIFEQSVLIFFGKTKRALRVRKLGIKL